jgi:hypothetical protein
MHPIAQAKACGSGRALKTLRAHLPSGGGVRNAMFFL